LICSEGTKSENFLCVRDAMLTIDNREDESMRKRFNKLGIAYELANLPVGDYLFAEGDKQVCIERKTVPDFIGSVYNQRIFKELEQMNGSYAKNYLIVSGDWGQIAFNPHLSKFSVEQKLGVFAHVLTRYDNIKMCFVPNDNQFVGLILKVWEKSIDGKMLGDKLFVHAMKKDPYIGLLCQFRNVSVNKAQAIKSQYPCFNDFHQALLEGTFTCKNIGEKTIQSFKEVLI